MEKTLKLAAGVDLFTLLELLRKAAYYKGLELREEASTACSKSIKEYVLDDKLLAVLAKNGIRRQDRLDCGNEIITLVDKNSQQEVPGWLPSNYWNFKLVEADGGRSKFDLRISLFVGFRVNIERRGIVLAPRAHGPFVSAADPLPNFRMFKALVENDKNAPAVAKELATSDGTIVISWTELGLGGIRQLSRLFAEFAGSNDSVVRLGRINRMVFDPAPNPDYQRSSDELFITEPAQPKLFQVWRAQLEDYTANLFV